MTNVVPIGSICSLQNGRAFKPTEWSESGTPIIRIQNLNDESKPFNYCQFEVEDRFHVKSGDLLFSWSGTPGTSFGAFFWNRGKGFLNQHIFRVDVDDSKISKNYLRLALNSQLPIIMGQAHGGVGLQHITKGKLEAVEIYLPPLTEQRRIAAILDKADFLRAKRREALAQLDSLAQSIFVEMFGDPVTNPKGWPTKPLSELVANGDTINYGVIQPGDDVEDGIPLVRVGDLVDGHIQHLSLKRIAPDIENAYKRSRLQGDEILVSCVGSIGVVALASHGERGFNIARAVARIRLSDVTDRMFIATQLRTASVQAYFTQELRTVSQPTLNIKQLAATRIVCPPLELQRQFAAVIAAVESLKAAHMTAIDKLEALFASIQSRGFQGEL